MNRSNPNNDYEVASPPSDGVSTLSWSPAAEHLAAGAWDGCVRVWEVLNTGATNPLAEQTHQAPVLATAWDEQGGRLFSGGCDNAVMGWDLGANEFTQVGAHDGPVSDMFWCASLNTLVTASWDATLRFWDFRQPQPVCSHKMPERVRCMSHSGMLCVAACALGTDKPMVLFDLRTPQQIYGATPSPLKYQTRSIDCFIDGSGYAAGSIEGRVAVRYIDGNDDSNFAFKCHRNTRNNHIFAVNSISFHPRFGTLATAGSDGQYLFWDKDSRQRLKAFKQAQNSISASSFNRDGSIYAYAVSYDWSKGAASYKQNEGSWIYLHPTPDDEIRSRPRK
ncbi:transducin family protein/WD-40 repeat family protein [Thecamonas trahens ATCC 50062]|uniref:Transducin family protein/WD-40 repeat family protein n=1 Tax=Thecamonas trahens ATCC 50062 TaxID=461836 RepID=A0A0L0D2C8_THETB|nr:transducin family protein/WD-40 repeat family protein [Thecamonas trahens ATCC 50062]KNC46295.1 transducin family protein/WD-40 repeat family protein [Thecamonas trahens ATCC 50062]|eukprot:XP_013760589.1 transducin family protein/WD-40 repeat family protein [Thecamonas trahens ATCC 50062]